MLVIFIRTLLLYFALIICVRVMGKRQVGQMGPSEFVVTMLAANLVSIPMEDAGVPLLSGLIPLGAVLGAELCISGLTMNSRLFRHFLRGRPVILVENGRVLSENLRRTRVTMEELMEYLRLKDVLELRQVQYAILETNGSLSVFPWPGEEPASAKDAGIRASERRLPIPIIVEGCLSWEDLKKAGKDEAWLRRILAEKGAGVESTLLLSLTGSQVTLIKKEGQ